MIKKVVIGHVHYAAGRAFLPIIEETAKTQDSGGIFFARPMSLIVIDGESIRLYPIDSDMGLDELYSLAPLLPNVLEETREILLRQNLAHYS